MNSRAALRSVPSLVARRGYVSATAAGSVALSAMKLVEEAIELALVVDLDPDLDATLCETLRMVRSVFDIEVRSGVAPYISPDDRDQLVREMADVQVVLLGLAHHLGKLVGCVVDPVELAVQKARADAGRGVRG